MKRIVTIPTLLAMILLVFGIGVGVVGVRQGRQWFSKAAPGEEPKGVKITNITDRSFTASWVTDAKVIGFIRYGEAGTSLSNVAVDARSGEFDTHYVEVEGLKPDAVYEFRIGSGKKLYDNAGVALSIKTAPLIKETPLGTDIIQGQVAFNGGAASGTIVYLETESLSPLSAMVKSSGIFTIPISSARSIDLSSFYDNDLEGGTFTLFIEGGGLGRATAIVGFEDRASIPEIEIPGDYDFSKLHTENANGDDKTQLNLNSKFSFDGTAVTETGDVTLSYPAPLEKVNVSTPEIFGKASPGKNVTITIESEPQTTTIKADSNGEWRWSPPNDLEPGDHTVTISYVDSSGNLRSIVRRFTVVSPVLAQDGLGFTASSSASQNPTLTPSTRPSPTPTDRQIASANTPTPSRTPTPTRTPTPSRTPTPTITIKPSSSLSPTTIPENSLPVAGNFEFTLGLIGVGWLLIGLGALVSFYSRDRIRR